MNELFSIKDKCYVLSGGTGTLGGSIADYLVLNGATVVLLGRSLEKLKIKQAALEVVNPGHAHIFVVDVMNKEALNTFKVSFKKQFPKLDGLIKFGWRQYSWSNIAARSKYL